MTKKSAIFSEFEDVVDKLPDIIFILQEDLTVLFSNACARELFGSRAILSANNLSGLLLPEEREAFHASLPWKDGMSGETQFLSENGAMMHAIWKVRALQKGRRTAWLFIAHDTTIEKQKDLDLLRFSNVIQRTINPIQITDASGNMVYVNPAFEKVSGYTSAELIGRNPRILNSGRHSKEFWSGVWQHISSGRIWVGKIENRRKDGSPIFMEVVLSPIIDAAGTILGYLGAHRDITEQKILEQQLIRSQKMESIGTLAAGIAHEVGNPLTAISSLVQVIQRTSSDGFAKEKLELINSQINRITRIIRELVDFSRPSTYIVKPTDINQVVRESLNIVRYGKKVKNISFELLFADEMLEITAVPDQIVQVFINILMNAVDSLEGRTGGILVSSRKKEQTVEVTIRDTGKGIESSELEKIFEPFYTTKEVGRGTGLGLWVSYGIVKSFRGDIFVESIPDRGSTFTVSFPVKG